MSVIVWKLFTLVVLLLFVFFTALSLNRNAEVLDHVENTSWKVRAKRLGAAKSSIRNLILNQELTLNEIPLGTKSYLIGNRLRDDLYIDTSGKRILIYLNVHRTKIYMTILRGNVRIKNTLFSSDKSSRLEVDNGTKIVLNDVELEFVKCGGMQKC